MATNPVLCKAIVLCILVALVKGQDDRPVSVAEAVEVANFDRQFENGQCDRCCTQDDDCDGPSQEELDSIGREADGSQPVVALECEADANDAAEIAKIASANGEAAAENNRVTLQLQAEQAIVRPVIRYRPVCDRYTFYKFIPFRIWGFFGEQRICYSSTPVKIVRCRHGPCNYRNNYYYRSYCRHEYCPQAVWVVCKSSVNGQFFPAFRRVIWVRCCCSCYHRYYYFSEIRNELPQSLSP